MSSWFYCSSICEGKGNDSYWFDKLFDDDDHHKVIYLWEWGEWLMLINFVFIVQQIWTKNKTEDWSCMSHKLSADLVYIQSHFAVMQDEGLRLFRKKQNTTTKRIPLLSYPFIAVTWASCATKHNKTNMIFSISKKNYYIMKHSITSVITPSLHFHSTRRAW